MTNSMKGLDPKALPPKLVDGLNQIVDTAYKDSFGDWHITADEGRVRKLCKAAAAALSSLPEPGAEAEGVEPIGWLDTLPPHDPVYGATVDWRDTDAVLKLPDRTPLYASPAFPTPASTKTRVKPLEWKELPILIYTVEDEPYVVLKVAGVVVAQRLVTTAAGIAILKLDAALSALTPEAEKGDGE